MRGPKISLIPSLNVLIYFLFQVQEQMRQLEEQIRVLVEESFMRKRRRMDPQASTATATSNTQGCLHYNSKN